jgi:hypothetical protein
VCSFSRVSPRRWSSFLYSLLLLLLVCAIFVLWTTSYLECNTGNTTLPDFWKLVNHGDACDTNYITVGNGSLQCTMCGEPRPRNPRHKGSKIAPVIPTRNKGICTTCDMEAWHFVESDVAVKFCHGCRNFRPCGDFGSQGELMRCDKCRIYCRTY